jgi:hypothetical protein
MLAMCRLVTAAGAGAAVVAGAAVASTGGHVDGWRMSGLGGWGWFDGFVSVKSGLLMIDLESKEEMDDRRGG